MGQPEVVFWIIMPFYLWLLWPQAKADILAWWDRKQFRAEIREIERSL